MASKKPSGRCGPIASKGCKFMQPQALTDAQEMWERELAIVSAQMDVPLYAAHVAKARQALRCGATQDGDAWLIQGTTQRYRVTTQFCECPQGTKRGGMCYHRVAVEMVKRCIAGGVTPPALKEEVMKSPEPSTPPIESFVVEFPPVTPPPRLKSQYIMDIHGKPHVTFAGLLDLAHQMGLKSLLLEVLEISEKRAVFMATVTTGDGCIYQDVGDATPENVTAMVKPHFIRVAATRAKARALRNACNVDMVVIEELGDLQEGVASAPLMTPPTDYGDLIVALLQRQGKPDEDINAYIAKTKAKYGDRLEAALPGIYEAMLIKEARKAVPMSDEEAPF